MGSGEQFTNARAHAKCFVGRGGSPNRPRAIEVNRPYLIRRLLNQFPEITQMLLGREHIAEPDPHHRAAAQFIGCSQLFAAQVC